MWDSVQVWLLIAAAMSPLVTIVAALMIVRDVRRSYEMTSGWPWWGDDHETLDQMKASTAKAAAQLRQIESERMATAGRGSAPSAGQDTP